MTIRLQSALYLVSALTLLVGCQSTSRVSPQSQKDCNQDWLDEKHLTTAIDREWATIRNESLTVSHQKQMIALQERADLLLKVIDANHLSVLRAVNIPVATDIIPISDLGKLLIKPRPEQAINSAVIILPEMLATKTPEIVLMRRIDAALCRAGVKQRIFETSSGGLWVGLKSPLDS